MAPSLKPSPLTWTFRLKNRKKTTLLHVDPYAPFANLKEELLHALHITHPSGILYDNVHIPTEPADVLLARPKDVNDVSQGWIHIHEADDADEVTKEKKKEAAIATPKAIGLKDNAVLAFKFRSGDEDEGLGLDDEEWEVTIPIYEDITGTINEGDVGAIANYNG